MKIPAGTTTSTTTPRRRRYRQALAALAVVAGAAAFLTAAVPSSGQASAAALPREVCAVAAVGQAAPFGPDCGTHQPSKSYTAQFVVLDSTGFDVTWTLPPGVATSCVFHFPCVSLGCHRGDTVCVVSAKNDPQREQEITVSATIGLLTTGSAAPASDTALVTPSGPVGSLWPMHVSSTASIAPSCGTQLCHTP